MIVTRVIGVTLIFVGLLSVVVQSLIITYNEARHEKHEAYGTGFWAGCVFVVAGVAGLLATMRPKGLPKIAALLVYLVAIKCSIAQITISSVTINSISTERNIKICDLLLNGYCTDRLIFNSLLVSAGIVASVASILQVKVGLKKN